MGKDKVKVFKDSIHGYIEIPSVIVSNIIDTEQFQRLRYIEQTSMRSLYPAARHDRFIHSLGVYYLGKLAFGGFEENSKKVINSLDRVNKQYFNAKEITPKWWNKQRLLFEIACLMHDCAHAPFSHTLEEYYLLKIDRKGNLKPVLSNLLAEECEKLGDKSFKEDFFSKEKNKSVGASHEQLSSYIILSEYKEAIRIIFKKLLPKTKVLDEDYAFICRMIIGCKYKEKNVEDSLKNCIISLLNSSTIDVDGLDYIVRDAHMSGVSAYDVDYQRILNSFTIMPVINYSKKEFEKANITGLWLGGSAFEISSFDGKIKGHFRIIIDPLKLKGKYSKGEGDFIIDDRIPHSKDYNSEVSFKNLKDGEMRLISSSKMDRVTFSGVITGKKIIAPEDEIFEKVSFVLGYDKRCLSILQNTIDARNNEYLWIYTHPKVLYNSHFLQCALLDTAAEYLSMKLNSKYPSKSKKGNKKFGKEDCIVQILGYSQLFDNKDFEICKKLKKLDYYFYRSNDDDINALFKRIYLEIINGNDNWEVSKKFKHIYEDYYRRSQRKTFWKSFMEKEVVSDYCKSYNDFEGINHLLEDATALLEENDLMHYEDIIDERSKIFSDLGFEKVIVVYFIAKTKVIDFPDFFVRFGDRTERLCDILDSNMLGKRVEKPVHFIFYEGDEINDYRIILELNEKLNALYDERRRKELLNSK